MSWGSHAACQDVSAPDIFYSGNPRDEAAAKAICATCPVRKECTTFVLSYETNAWSSWGIWGGLTAQERIKVRA